VRSVEAGSAAAQAGLRAADLIVGANRGHVGTVRELHERAKGAAVLVLEVRRGNTVLLIPLR
jgi:S1-C subfamily serine protease